jgi:hypothetical protein
MRRTRAAIQEVPQGQSRLAARIYTTDPAQPPLCRVTLNRGIVT